MLAEARNFPQINHPPTAVGLKATDGSGNEVGGMSRRNGGLGYNALSLQCKLL